MQSWTFTHLSNGLVLKELDSTRSGNRRGAAKELALIAEVDERKIFADEGYPGIREFTLDRLGLTPDAAAKRIQAARVARRFPVLFEAIADGRLNRSAVALLAPHFRSHNIAQLIEAATRRSYREIEAMLVERSRAAVPQMDLASPEPAGDPEITAEPGTHSLAASCDFDSHAAPHVEVKSSAAASLPVHFTVSGEDLRLLIAAHELLPTLDTGGLYQRSLRQMVQKLRRARFGIGARRERARRVKGARTIPAHVRLEVYERDGGCCAYVSAGGRRCECRRFLEYDHIVPLAQGGDTSLANLRLLCRTHNQLEADRRLGKPFMDGKREQGRERTMRRLAEKQAREHEAVGQDRPAPAA
jgi:hypothetical protein